MVRKSPIPWHLVGVPGRMELVSKEKEPTVFLDYAHTPDGLEKALRSIREHFGEEVNLFFGCGGDRILKTSSYG